MSHITSSSNPQFKAIVKLVSSSKQRRESGRSVLDGVHLIQAYRSLVGTPEQLIVSESGIANSEIQELIRACSAIPIVQLSDRLFAQVSTVDTPTGILSIITTPDHGDAPETTGACVMIEGVQDPGNLGSILRSCAAAAIGQVVLSTDSANVWSPRVLRAAMGAHFELRIYERVDLQRFAQDYSGRVIVTLQNADASIYDTDLRGDVAFVLGNEGAGVSKELRRLSHASISIPMLGKVESLNVAAAAAICFFERARQMS